MTSLINNSNQHFALTKDFDTLYQKLSERVATDVIYKISDGNGLEIFNYGLTCQFDKTFWDNYSLISRGLILCPAKKKIVALPFPKFFNYGEITYDLPKGSFSITEKVDGSLGIIYFWNDQWNVSTRGSFNSDQAKWAKDWLYNNVDVSKLNTDLTYLAEIIYQENRIVISYDFEGLVFLSAYNRENGLELSYDDICKCGSLLGLRVVKKYFYNSIEEIVAICKNLDHNSEGFVIQFLDGYRIKIKGDEYCRVHRLISNVTPLRVWDMMLNGDNMDVVAKQLPEELRKDFDNISEILTSIMVSAVKSIEEGYLATKHLTDKEVGLMLDDSKLNKIQRQFLFACRKKNFFAEWQIGGSRLRRNLFNNFRPCQNRLEGYTPSTVMNRFSEDEG